LGKPRVKKSARFKLISSTNIHSEHEAMAGAHRIAQIRYEAEIYHDQGLHKEALAIYDRFLSNTKEIHPALEASIRESMRRIRSFAQDNEQQEHLLMSDIEITVIKKGWNSRTTVDDCVTSARALTDLNHYDYALEEYRRLLVKKCLTTATIAGATLCLVNLNPSAQFAHAVDLFAKDIFNSPKNRLAFKLLILKNIDSEKYPMHLSALYNHFIKEESVSGHVIARIRAKSRPENK
jgi:tetratricopeptide (TPR) repeat protein